MSTMKYHYFHGRFTYSVKRSGPPRAGRPAPVPLRSVSILELKRERAARSPSGRSSARRAKRRLFRGAIRAGDIAGWGV